MKKKVILFALCLLVNVFANAYVPTNIQNSVRLVFVTQIVNKSPIPQGTHRTPPMQPEVFLDLSTKTVYSETPFYDYTLNIVDVETGESVCCSVIPDGADSFELPEGLSGEYEIQLIRDSYMFVGIIEL